MERNTESEKQTPVPKKKMSNFRKAFLWTAILIIVFAAIGMPGAIAPYTAWPGFVLLGGIAFGLWVLAVLACIGLFMARKDEIARGLLTGIGIGFLSVAVLFTLAEFNQPR